MPPLDEQIEDMASSNMSDLDEQQSNGAASAKPETTADDAKSSAATGEDGPELLDIVRDVVDKRPKPEAASPAEGEETGDKDQGDDQKKQDDDNYSDVPFHKHPRFQHLLRQKKAADIDAVRYRNVQTFLDTNGLTADEAGDMLVIGALAKTDPAEAWKQVKPWVQKLLIAAGEVLPEDVQQRVQAGEISHEAALELTRARASTQSMQAAQTFRQQQEERRRQQELGSSIMNAAASWEEDRRVKDPNFAAKQEPLMREVAWLQTQEGKPNTPEGVKDQLQRAYKAVNAAFVPPQPKPAPRPAVRPVTGGQVAGNAQPSQMTTLDIVRANRRAAAG